MSYLIFYDKQFVKLVSTGEVIPMILAGDNNVYEASGNNKGRRSRSWQNIPFFNNQKRIAELPEVILGNIDKDFTKTTDKALTNEYRDANDTPENVKLHYGYYASIAISGSGTRGTTFSQFRGFFSSGIKKAMTIEQLAEIGIYLSFEHYPHGEDNAPDEVNIRTEAQYFIERDKWLLWLAAEEKRYFNLRFYPHDDKEISERLRAAKPKTTPQMKIIIEQDHYFVLADEHNNGLIKYTPRGFRYACDASDGKRYRTEKEAETHRNKLVTENRYEANAWKVKRIDKPTTFVVSKEPAKPQKQTPADDHYYQEPIF